MSSKVLLINDIAGYGKVALSAMIPVLTALGYDIYNLPTALVSNTLDYGKFRIQDNTEYMKDTIKVWKELGFKFGAISTGFLANAEQSELLINFCKSQSERGVKIFVDPIMADNGSLYNGMNQETVESFRKLLKVADVTVPNYTEATLLTDTCYRESISEKEVIELIDKIRKLGSKSVVVTSLRIDDKEFVSGYDALNNNYFHIPYTSVPVFFPGTGDIFLSLLMGHLLRGLSLRDSTQIAMSNVKNMVIRNRDNHDKFKGIKIENCLDIIMESN